MPSFVRNLAVKGKRLTALCCFFMAVLLPPSVAISGGGTPDPYPVAMRSFGVWEPHTGERFDFSVWYPSNSSTPPTPGIKEGWITEYAKRGRIIPGFYPVVLLSHDTASSRYANNDIAVSLAAGGFVVIIPSHTGDNQNNSNDIYTAALLRNRPRQLLRALETVMESPDFSHYVDESRIGLIGIGFGSISVLQLAGARPDLNGLREHCPQSPEGDAFCESWTMERLQQAAALMPGMEQREGKGVFTPPLALYAPDLTPAIVPQEVLLAFEAQSGPAEGESKPGLWQRLFGGGQSDDKGAGKQEEAVAAKEQDTRPGGATDTESATTVAASGEQFPLELDFQGGPLFGGTDSGSPFIYIAMPDSPEFRAGVGEDNTTTIAAPEPQPVKPDASTVFRRPSALRQIRGIALVAPAGGMLFTADSLQGVKVPVAMIEAGKDRLYPPELHAQPYYVWLPAPPLVLRLASSDHFSLFAACSKDSLSNLGEICGNLTGEEREKIGGQRDHFLVNFFQSTLGVPLPPARPSGFIAVPAEH